MPTRAARHRRPEATGPRPAQHRRGSAAKRGYDRRWRRIRLDQLIREPLCRHCARRGIVTAAAEVDHIRPITGPDDPLFDDVRNLQSLCKPHHSAKTVADTRAGLTRST